MESYMASFAQKNVIKQRGITFLELLAALAIVSSLAVIALPSFENVFKENRISQAKSTLLGMQLKLDKYLYQHREFPENNDRLVGIDTESSHYEFLIEHDESCGSKWCYALVALPKNKDRMGELLKVFSSGNREGDW